MFQPSFRSCYARNLDFYLAQKGMSSKQLATEIGVSDETIRRIRRLDNIYISLEILCAICEILNVTPNDLLTPHSNVDYGTIYD